MNLLCLREAEADRLMDLPQRETRLVVVEGTTLREAKENNFFTFFAFRQTSVASGGDGGA